jgi:hypothetical protein
MRFLAVIGLLILASGILLGQTDGSAGADKPKLTDDLNQLRDVLAQQQKQMAEQQRQIAEQQRLMSDQQKQIAREQEEIEKLRLQVESGGIAPVAGRQAAPQLVNAALTTSSSTNAPVANVPPVSNAPVQEVERKESPLSFRIGGMDFTPGGFIEAENVFRTTNSGSIISTNFGTIPFSNTAQGHLTESRLTGQFSRLNLKVTGKLGATDITGYVEMDFNGNDAANVFESTNSHTLRERVFWADVHHGNWEILGGQTWSFLTPSKQGMSAMPSDLAITLDEDGNAQVGIPYTRAAEVRFIYHPNEHFAAGVALENPEQITGSGAGEVTFPTALTAQLANQFDPNNTTNTTPNVAPDVIPKITYDTTMGGRHFHAEALGLLTTVKTVTLQPVAGSTFSKNSATGGGGGAAMNLELVHNFRFLANAFYGDGGAHYLIALGPSAVVSPSGSPSLVHSGMGLAGFEYQPLSKTQFGLYYGAAYFQRNFFLDTSAGAKPNTFIGFGGPNSANTNNKSLQQPTFDWRQTFWQNPQYGAIQLITQTSYLTRSPWFVAAGAPKNAHLVMIFTSLRYVIP